LPNLPDVFFAEEIDEIKKHAYIHERGYVTNIAPNYMRLMSKGFDAVIKDVQNRLESALPEDKAFYENELIILNAIIDFANRYKEEAIKQNYKEIAEDLEVSPKKAPTTFRQALQMLRLIHYVIWVEG
jgi:formate C-acetyltransferase